MAHAWTQDPDPAVTTRLPAAPVPPVDRTQVLTTQPPMAATPLAQEPLAPPVQAADPGPLRLSEALREDWSAVRPSYGDHSHVATDTMRRWFADSDNVLMAVTGLVMLLLVFVVAAFGH